MTGLRSHATPRPAGQPRGEEGSAVSRRGLGMVLCLLLAVGCGAGDGRDNLAVGPTASRQLENELAAQLLQAEAVAKLRGEPGEWQERADEVLAFDPLPSGCQQDDQGETTASATTFLDGPGEILLGQVSLAYATVGEAEEAFAWVVDEIACTGQVVDGLAGAGPSRVYGSSQHDGVAVSYAVEQVGSYLVALALRSPEAATRLEDLPLLIELAAGRIRRTLVEPQPTAEPVAAPDDGLLRAQDLAAAGLGDWTVQSLTDPEGGPTACMAERLPQGYPEVGGWSRANRDADGALVQQSTSRHASAAAATEQLSRHVAAVRACPSEEVLDWPAEPRVVLSVATHQVVEQSSDLLLVRTAYACETCAGRATYLAVVRRGPWLTVLNLPAEPGAADPAGLARKLMDAAATRLAAAH